VHFPEAAHTPLQLVCLCPCQAFLQRLRHGVCKDLCRIQRDVKHAFTYFSPHAEHSLDLRWEPIAPAEDVEQSGHRGGEGGGTHCMADHNPSGQQGLPSQLTQLKADGHNLLQLLRGGRHYGGWRFYGGSLLLGRCAQLPQTALTRSPQGGCQPRIGLRQCRCYVSKKAMGTKHR